jgi:hypothetical protein
MRTKKAPLSLIDNGAFTTEKEGFEPTVRRRTTVFKTANQNTQPLHNKELTGTDKDSLQTSLQTNPNLTPELTDVITAWPTLPSHMKAAIAALIKAAQQCP